MIGQAIQNQDLILILISIILILHSPERYN